MPTYVPQLRRVRGLASRLDGGVYAIRPREVVRGDEIVPAARLRSELGLSRAQALVLILFDRDVVLENLWGPTMIGRVADAQYDCVVSPSYSTWVPRPRTETLVSLKRSHSFFMALQELGVAAIPRVAWEVKRDVERQAAWVAGNRHLSLVAIDLQTYRSAQDWRRQLAGLRLFERATGQRLRYLINGATAPARCASLFEVIPPERTHITNATSQLGLRTRRGVPGLASVRDLGLRFEMQLDLAKATIARSAERSHLKRAA